MEVPPKRSRRALLWTSTTYFGEGLPWSVLHQMGTEFLTTAKASSAQIAATSYFHLAVSLKFLLSPIVDSIATKRAWLIATQLVLAAGMVAVGLAASAATAPHFAAFWVVGGIFSIVHATHDIACDGFYMQALDKHGQALYSGVRTAAFRMAMLVGSSFLVVLAGHTTWLRGFSVAGAIMLVVALVNSVATPRVAEDTSAPRRDRASERAAFRAAYKGFIRQPQAVRVIFFMLVYRLGDVMMFTMSKPLLRDIGVDVIHRGYLNTPVMITTIVGALVGGGVIARLGLPRTLVPILYLQNLAIPIYIALAVLKPRYLRRRRRHRARRAARLGHRRLRARHVLRR